MERHLRKAQKRMKREVKRLRDLKSSIKDKNRYWPSIYCTYEKIFIAVSNVTVGFGHDKYKIVPDHWKKENCRFRSEEYRIIFEDIKDGQEVMCPHCKNKQVDFRLWISSKRPEFYEPR